MRRVDLDAVRRRGIAVAAVFVLVIAGATAAMASRTDTVHAIQARAQRDEKQLGKPDVATTLKLFEDNRDGLSPRNIAAIYDQAYDAAAKKDKSSFARLKANAPWLVALLALLAFLFRDAVKGWATAAANAIGNRFWQRFAGSRLMRRTALKRYRRSLAAKMRDVRIIFRRNKPLDMSRVFVPVRVMGSGEDRKIDALEAVARHHRVVVIGPPGAGKSILLRHIAYIYASSDTAGGPVPIPLELHRLSDPNTTVTDELAGVLDRNGFPNGRGFLERNLESGGVLLLLDGLDEVRSAERPRVAMALSDLLERHPRAPAVITCRNAVYRQEFGEVADRTFELVEFTDQQVQAFLASWAPEMPSGKSAEQLVLSLREHPRLMGLARNPLMLTIIAHLYTESASYQLPNSRGEFFVESSDILLRHWHESQNDFGPGEKRIALRQLALVGQHAEPEDASNRRSVDVDAAVQVVQEVLKNQGKPPEQARAMLDEIVERSGLLLSVDAGERFQFAHLTFQEYFVAEKMVGQRRELLSRYEAAPDDWREIVKLWCGLADDATEMINKLWDGGAELVALEAMADARAVDAGTASKVITPYVMRLRAGEADGAVERALGALAATAEGRGKQVLDDLRQALDDADTPDRRISAARAIAASNTPAAAAILAQHYHFEEVRAPLERLGDLAVPGLRALAPQHRDEPLESLRRVGTAAASRALAEIVWSSDTDVATRAAWRLAALLPSAEVERALSESSVPSTSGVSVAREWVWKPFADDANTALVRTAGRVADLLVQAPDATVPAERFWIDPRIVFPLWAVGATALNSTDFVYEPAPDHVVEAAVEVLNERPSWWLPKVSVHTLIGSVASALHEGRSGAGPGYRLGSARAPAPAEAVDRFTTGLVDVAPGVSAAQRYLFLSLPPSLRVDALARGMRFPRPGDWIAQRRPVDYEFNHSWQIVVWRTVALACAALGLLGAAHVFLVSGLVGHIAAVAGAAALIAGSVFLFTGWNADRSEVIYEFVLYGPLELFDDTPEFAMTVGFLPAIGYFGTVTLAGLFALGTWGVIGVWACAIGVATGVCAHAARRERASLNPFRDLDLAPQRFSVPVTATPGSADAESPDGTAPERRNPAGAGLGA